MNIDQQHPWTMIIQWRLTWKWHIKGILYTQCLSFACHWKVFGILMDLSCRNWTSCYTRSPSLVGKQSMYNDDIFRSYIRVRGAWVYQLLQFFPLLWDISFVLYWTYTWSHTGVYNVYTYIYIQYLYIYIYIFHSRYLMVHQIVHCLSSRDKHEISHYHVYTIIRYLVIVWIIGWVCLITGIPKSPG